jgi:hypothetical protein
LVGLGTGGSVSECGPVVCVTRDGPDPRLDGIDPATGRVVWSAPCGDAAASRLFCYTDVRPLPGSGALAVRYEPLGQARESSSMLLDPATGAQVMNLFGWFPLAPVTGADQVLYRVEPPSERLPRPPDQIRLGRLRAGPAGIETLGAVRAQRCDRNGTYLVCGAGGVLVEVWRIR